MENESAEMTKDDVPVTLEDDPIKRISETKRIRLEDLVPFEDHPYKVLDNEDMEELMDSIKEIGLINPLIVRPKDDENGKYEIISGHRRYRAAQRLGMTELDCTVYPVDRDTATEMMVSANCQRSNLLPSEKAKAYKMRLDAMKRQGKRTDLTSDPAGPKLKRSNQYVAESANESLTQVKRYIRLNYLVPELLEFVDEGKIKLRTAVELSYLCEETQRDIVDCIDGMDGETFPSYSQAVRIRKRAEENGISYDEIEDIITEIKPNQVEKVKIPVDELRKRIGRNMTDSELIEYIFKAVDHFRNYIKRNQEQGR